MNKVKAVIFDMDGVIFDTEAVWKKAFLQANVIYGLTTLTEEYRASICGKKEATIREELKLMHPEAKVDEYRDYMLSYVKEAVSSGNYEIKPHAVEILTYLRNRGYKVALATSSHRDRAEMMFKNKGLDLSNHFDATIFADDLHGKPKPDPTIFLLASEKLGVLPGESYVIEDSINGIEAAVRGGFMPIMAVDLIEPDQYCYDNCKKIIRSLRELEALI
ncbi:MAG: HAD family phosphatase [Clostridia bacterium]|nr:HAD family phosphatase [Clostridia bacterium]